MRIFPFFTDWAVKIFMDLFLSLKKKGTDLEKKRGDSPGQ